MCRNADKPYRSCQKINLLDCKTYLRREKDLLNCRAIDILWFACVFGADTALTQPLTEIAIRLTRNGMSHTSAIVRGNSQFEDMALERV